MKNLIPRWYIVGYTINWKKHQDTFSTIETDKRMIEADFNSELDSKFYWENREIIDYCRIKTPETQKISWLEEYYKMEEKMLEPDEIILPF